VTGNSFSKTQNNNMAPEGNLYPAFGCLAVTNESLRNVIICTGICLQVVHWTFLLSVQYPKYGDEAQTWSYNTIFQQLFFLQICFNFITGARALGELSRCSDGLHVERLGFHSRQGQETFLFSTAFRLALKFTQLPIQWVPGHIPRG
jgi:hypothetical protein